MEDGDDVVFGEVVAVAPAEVDVVEDVAELQAVGETGGVEHASEAVTGGGVREALGEVLSGQEMFAEASVGLGKTVTDGQ